MQWNSLSEFISMGGYGFYVWGSYGVTFVLLAAELIMLRTRRRRLMQAGQASQRPIRKSDLETVL